MKKLLVLILGATLATAVMAEEINRTVDAAKDGHVDISNISGDVTVHGWKRSEVEVTGTLGRNVKELIVERDGDKVLIKVKVPRNGGRGIDSNLRIQVPKGSSINIGTVSADITVNDVEGEQSLHTVSGDLETEYTGANLEAESVSGDVVVSGHGETGETRASTVSGDVRVFKVAGEVSAETVSGDVLVEAGTISRAELGAVSGEVFLRATLGKGGKIIADTVNGDIGIEIDGEISAEIEVDSLNGDINNCFGPKAQRISKYGPGVELEFTEGGGDGQVRISSMNGDIRLCNR